MSEQEAKEPGKTEASPKPLSGIQEAKISECPAPLPEATWENMHNALYSYYFVHIDFLTLLDQWEEIFHIKSSPVKPPASTKRKAGK